MNFKILEAYWNKKKVRCKHWAKTDWVGDKYLELGRSSFFMVNDKGEELPSQAVVFFMTLMVENYKNWEVMEVQADE